MPIAHLASYGLWGSRTNFTICSSSSSSNKG
jgi:hypothetical protein